MTNIGIYNGETQTNEIRPMNPGELDEKEQQNLDYVVNQKKVAEADAAKSSAQAKLTALGLTTDDLKALGL
jgi:hypothetical protein